MRFARSLGTECTMTLMTPFPGTPMYWRALRENLLIRGREMTYEDWNSYTATMRTYKLNLRELKFARLWARLETYVPYTWNQNKNAPAKQKARALAILAPRVAALGALRLYAAWRLRAEERADPSLRQEGEKPSAVGVRLPVLSASAAGGSSVNVSAPAPSTSAARE